MFDPTLNSIELSSDEGKRAYALQALAPGNAFVVFDDHVDDPGASASVLLEGGTVVGLFFLPNATLTEFQDSPESFDVEGRAASAERWPFFALPSANPGGFDQLLSFNSTSLVTGSDSTLFAWEDLTRVRGNPLQSDRAFNDLIVAVDGLVPVVPEPSGLTLVGIASLVLSLRSGNRRE